MPPPLRMLGVPRPILDVGSAILEEPVVTAGPAELIAPRPPPDLRGTVLGDAPYQPTRVDRLVEDELGAMVPRGLPEFPRFLTAPAATPAAAPAVAPPPTAPPLSSVPFLRALETGRSVEQAQRELAPAPAAAPVRRAPSMLGRPRARPVPAPPPSVNSLGQPLAPDFVDAMTQTTGPIFRTPQETAYDRERRAIATAQQLEQQRQEMIGRQAMDAADAEEAYVRRQNQLEAERRQAEGNARDSMIRATDRLAAMRVEPGRYWRDQGAAGTIFNAIAVGLGAMGESMGGGPNRAIEAIQQGIDRDLRAQEQDIATAGNAVEARRGILSEVRQDYTSRQGALEASRAIMLREAAARAEAEAAAQGSAEAVANGGVLRDRLLTQAEQAAAAAEREEINALLEMRQTLANIRRTEARASQEEARAARMAGAGQGPQRPDRVSSAQWIAYRDGLANGLPPAASAQLAGIPAEVVPQLTGSPVTTEQRSALDALDASLRTVEDGISAGEQTGDIAGVGVVDRNLPAFLQSDDGLAMRTAIDNTIDLLGRLRSGAAITEDEWLRFARVLEGSGTERELRIGIQQIRAELAGRLGLAGRRQAGTDAADAALAAAGARRVE